MKIRIDIRIEVAFFPDFGTFKNEGNNFINQFLIVCPGYISGCFMLEFQDEYSVGQTWARESVNYIEILYRLHIKIKLPFRNNWVI